MALDDQSLTNDELDDLEVARQDGDFGTLLKGARRFPPLYHLILRGWLRVFPSDYSARVLSVALGLALIVVLWLLGRAVAGNLGGIAVAAFAAISPLTIWYSQETRVYGLVLLLAALAMLFLIRSLESGSTRDWVWFSVFCVAGIYTHYYFVVFVAIAVGLVAVRFVRSGRPAIPWAVLAGATIAAAPSLLLLVSDQTGAWGASSTTPFGVSGFGYTYVSVFTGYTVGPSLRDLHSMDVVESIRRFLPALLAIAATGTILGLSGLRVLRRDHATLLATFTILPVLIVGVASSVAPFGFNPRHVIWIAIPIALWMGAGLTRIHQPLVLIGAALLIIVSVVALSGRVWSDDYRNEDSRAVARYLETQADQSPVFVISDYMAEPLEYYLTEGRAVVAIGNITEADPAPAVAFIDTRGESYWLAVSREFHGDPEGSLVDALLATGSIQHVADFAGYQLYRSTP
jgi:uncharacterized membrane protein